MARVLALALTSSPRAPLAPALDVLRSLIVAGCALSLILAGVDLGF